jgi:hypothetical protein
MAPDAKIIDWLAEITADCPKNYERSMRCTVPGFAEGLIGYCVPP